MTDIFIAFIIGALAGYCARPKDKDYEEQQALYDKKVIQYEIDLAYYKELCKWHVNQRKENGNK